METLPFIPTEEEINQLTGGLGPKLAAFMMLVKDTYVRACEGGTLDRERRGGGWGAVSGDVSKAVGGVWTARSLRTVTGTLEKARQHNEQG